MGGILAELGGGGASSISTSEDIFVFAGKERVGNGQPKCQKIPFPSPPSHDLKRHTGRRLNSRKSAWDYRIWPIFTSNSAIFSMKARFLDAEDVDLL
jgi:hypothetical protein